MGARLRRVLRPLLGGLALPLLGGCVTGTYTTVDAFRAPAPDVLVRLAQDDLDLDDCLDLLGAPLIVFEQGRRAVLAWGWRDQQGWNVTLSAPVTDQASVNFSYTDNVDDLRGVMGFFDADWKLTELREGRLSELIHEERRPALAVQVLLPRAAPLQE